MTAYVAAGSNLGDRWAHLAHALSRLGGQPSPVYQSAPIGGPPQGSYLNGVILLDWHKDPGDLLDLCLDIERECWRERRVRWGPRTLDLDVIAVGTIRIRRQGLEVPHPRALERAFVVRPLLDLGLWDLPWSIDRVLRARRATSHQRLHLVGIFPRTSPSGR